MRLWKRYVLIRRHLPTGAKRSVRNDPCSLLKILICALVTRATYSAMRGFQTEPYSNSYYWAAILTASLTHSGGLKVTITPLGSSWAMSRRTSSRKKCERPKGQTYSQCPRSRKYWLWPLSRRHVLQLLKRKDDKDGDSKDSFIAVVHFWATEGKTKAIAENSFRLCRLGKSLEKGTFDRRSKHCCAQGGEWFQYGHCVYQVYLHAWLLYLTVSMILLVFILDREPRKTGRISRPPKYAKDCGKIWSPWSRSRRSTGRKRLLATLTKRHPVAIYRG